MFWQGGDVVRAQNIWRHWYLAHEIPRINGQPPATIIAGTGDSTNDVNKYLQAGINPNILWRDADTEPYVWYPCTNGPYTGSISWLNTGTWEVDTSSYPHGFKELTTAIHALGMKFLLWFEPERVGDPNSWLAKQHPEWLLPRTQNTVGEILNEGNPVAFNWLTNHIEGLIRSNGIDWYREDMNGDGPLTAWRNNDSTNRQGITENFYVQGHLAYWDALLAMNPGLRIDSCASGGRRNDLESMRRAVPLWRSDFPGGQSVTNFAKGSQCQTYGLSFWLPFQGSDSADFWDSYSTRSSILPSFGLKFSPDPRQARAVRECRRIAPIMLNGDYYPLTPYSLSDNLWLAWQFDRPGRGDGFVEAFRRAGCDTTTQTFRLSGLDPSAYYQITNFDLAGTVEIAGEELMDNGLTIEIKDKPGAAVILYQRIK
jgi:alpha-galactosidase